MKGFISKDLHPFNNIMLLFAAMVAGLCVAYFVFLIVLSIGFGYGLNDLPGITNEPADYPNGLTIVLLFQGLVHLLAFTIGPLLFLKFRQTDLNDYLSPKTFTPVGLLLLSGLLFLVIMPANSWMISYNATLDLPDFMSGFEQWAKAKEEAARILTQKLTKFESLPQFILGAIVVAAIPAIGEELVFRGILQPNLIAWTKNKHAGVWLAAIVFSAIHFQFYGFIPRMLLGALFGYLYLWSGRIWVPIFGHFVNNGFTVLMLYLYQRKMSAIDFESTEALPITYILFSLVVTFALLYVLYNGFKKVPYKPEVLPVNHHPNNL